jgi:hypothetical protein
VRGPEYNPQHHKEKKKKKKLKRSVVVEEGAVEKPRNLKPEFEAGLRFPYSEGLPGLDGELFIAQVLYIGRSELISSAS